MPPSNTSDNESDIIDEVEEVDQEPPSSIVWPVRILLLFFALVFACVLGVAIWLNPYLNDGQARKQETHRQLGLAPCNFYVLTKLPCPSCGMTTSFSLLMHGDVVNSMRANWVGTALASFCALYIPWSLGSVWLKRAIYIESIELAITRAIIAFLWLMLVRWSLILFLFWFNGLW